jgi:hypothetical protein
MVRLQPKELSADGLHSQVTGNRQGEALGLTEQLRHSRPTKRPDVQKNVQRYLDARLPKGSRLSRMSRGCTQTIMTMAARIKLTDVTLRTRALVLAKQQEIHAKPLLWLRLQSQMAV